MGINKSYSKRYKDQWKGQLRETESVTYILGITPKQKIAKKEIQYEEFYGFGQLRADARENELHRRQKCMIGCIPVRKDGGLDRHGRHGRI